MQKNISIVLLSGGMDSTVCTAIAHAQSEEVAALHVNYGQRTQARELQAFHDVCNYYSITKRLIVDISHLAAIGGSSLTDSTITIEPANLDRKDIPTSYVPFRNANILAIATSWAEVIHANKLYIGAVQDDSSGYPDCREEFFQAFQNVINTGTKPDTHISIETPIIHFDKSQIVQKGLALQAPFQLSWSCYKSEDVACGNCDSCALRLRGFQQAGATDPIPYQQ
ncbi:MAG: 7-cyano-7-deazaguanine synthase QueC [Candidatus Kapaibacterium sp.]|nr:7-cyano-7-deazaguanine synthase QueC [Bacteroidota bacterium]